MKLSKETLAILKNFSSINNNLLLLPGNKLSTISYEDSLVAYTEVQEDFPQSFGIYDLPEFLGALSLFEDPDLEFNSTHVKIKTDKHSIKFFSAEQTLLKIPVMNGNTPGIVSKFPASEIKFSLSAEQINMIIKTASVLKSSDIAILGTDDKLKVVVGDKKNSTANKFEIVLGDSDIEFTANLKVQNLKLIPGSYDVEISKKRVSKWTNEAAKLTYFVGLEADSTI